MTKKILICIDGLEEASKKYYPIWKTRIDELDSWLKQFLNIRFALSCRHYIPINMNPLSLDFVDKGFGNRSVHLYENDVELNELIPKYFEEYNIDISEAPWLIDSFQSLLELKLFCEFYKDQPITSNTTTHLNALVKEKIVRTKTEIEAKHPSISGGQDQVILKVLLKIANIFHEKYSYSSIERNEFLNLILDKNLSKLLNRENLSHIVNFFCNVGLLSEYNLQGNDSLTPDTYEYGVPYQSILEVIATIQYVKNVSNINDYSPPKHSNENILKFAAISLLTDKGILIGENGIWTTEFDEDKIFVLQLQAIREAGNSIVTQYKDWLKDKFLSSNKKRYQIMEYIIIPNARNPHFPINPLWLHDILMSFPSVFERDLIWSGEDYGNTSSEFSDYKNGRLLIPYYHEHMQSNHLDLFGLTLNKTDKHNGLPLVLAWSLTSIENTYREYCKNELSHWGSWCPDEFIKLLDLTFSTNDPQMRDDLINIAMGVASLIDKPEHISKLKKWAFDNVLNTTALQIHRSAIIRHSARMIVEKAFKLGVAIDTEIKEARPPYQLPFQMINLKADVVDNWSKDGVHPIKRDLFWYVIDKSYEKFIPSKSASEHYLKEIDDFFNKYELKYSKKFDNNGFAMAAAIQYIYDLGYNKKYSSYTNATHGSISKIATFEEKYTWCAVYYLIGYLSDYLPYYESRILQDDIEPKVVTNYQNIIQIPNPIQNYKINDIKINDKWLIPTELSPRLSNEINKDVLDNAVHNLDFNSFKEWLFLKRDKTKDIFSNSTDWMVLRSFTIMTSPDGIIQTDLDITTCLINEEDFNLFLECFDKIYPFKNEQPRRLHGSPSTEYSTSTKEIIESNQVNEIYNAITYEHNNQKFDVLYGITKVNDDNYSDGERNYYLPSKTVRQLLQIKKGDGKVFISNSNEVVSFSNKKRKGNDVQEVLLVNHKELKSKTKEQGLKLFWYVDINRRINPSKHEKLKFYARHRKTFLVYENGHKFNIRTILENDFRTHSKIKNKIKPKKTIFFEVKK